MTRGRRAGAEAYGWTLEAGFGLEAGRWEGEDDDKGRLNEELLWLEGRDEEPQNEPENEEPLWLEDREEELLEEKLEEEREELKELPL